MALPRVCLLPASADLLDRVAQGITENHRDALPDLTRVTVLLPGAAIGPLRTRLVRSAGGALLGPSLLTLPDFARARGAAEATPSAPALTPLDCRLMLVEALGRYRNLFPGQDLWRIAEALYTLFEELTANAVMLPDRTDAFTAQLSRAYGARPLAALSREAQIVHTLWQAFQTDTGGRSPAAVYARSLRAAFNDLAPDEHLYLVGLDAFTRTEAAAIAEALTRDHIHLWLHGRLTGRDGATTARLCAALGITPEFTASGANELLDAAFAGGDSAARERALALHPLGKTQTSLRITEAGGPEHEARCVELAVRRLWLSGARDIAVITQDRRLARRVRALLERAGLALKDHVGWALSTSRAAASLASWLDCLETDFHFRPLLDLLKSGFCGTGEDHERIVMGLERQVIYGEGIESGLRRYLAGSDKVPQLPPLLKQFAQAARGWPNRKTASPAQDWSTVLLRSLQDLGLWAPWQADAAGQVLIRQLETLHAAALRQPLRCSWAEFRALLDRALEQATFIPRSSASSVRLLTLEQTGALSCDAVILAAATRALLPAAPAGDPFFNQSVRGELGLPNWTERQALALSRFRRLLEAAPVVHITYAPETEGEPAQPSVWVEALEAFCAAAGAGSLRDPALARLAGSAAVEIAPEDAARPAPLPQPRPNAPAALLPGSLSAGAHQSLLDCPYQFYAGRCLGLRRPEEPDQEPDARDYGKRVHAILQAFHEQVEDLPAPFPEPVRAANKEQAWAKLEEIAGAVFEADVDTRILARAWLERFRALIPTLVDWLAERSGEWPRIETEQELQQRLDEGLAIIGMIDRLERNAAGEACVVDYKSGAVPRPGDVTSGEAVQLVHYALLADRTAQVEYWDLKNERIQSYSDEDLAPLKTGVRQRLVKAVQALRTGAPMPAQGDETTCERCDFGGLCRKGWWRE